MSDREKTQQELSDELDKVLLQIVKSGEATAPQLNVARQRLKDLGIGPPLDADGSVNQLAEELGLKDGTLYKLPALSQEPDAATG